MYSLFIALLASTFSNYSLLFAETYQWLDADGSIHFTDEPNNIPKSEQPNVRQEESNIIAPLPAERPSRSNKVSPAGQNKKEQLQHQKVDPIIEAQLQLVWKTFRDAIISADIKTALNQIVPELRSQYYDLINDSSQDIVARFKEIRRLEVYTITEKTAQAGAISMAPEGEHAYLVTFVNNLGEWKIVIVQ